MNEKLLLKTAERFLPAREEDLRALVKTRITDLALDLDLSLLDIMALLAQVKLPWKLDDNDWMALPGDGVQANVFPSSLEPLWRGSIAKNGVKDNLFELFTSPKAAMIAAEKFAEDNGWI